MILASNLFSKIGAFFKELRSSLSDGLLFLGGPLDVAIALFDIAITALVVYFILLLLRDSRAWQLLRGIILIVAFALVSSAVGLNTIGFMLNRTISILAIAIIVIFQPELRRTLETVGRNRLMYGVGNGFSADPAVRRMIEDIVNACESMANSKTGALIVIERGTRLGELYEQENAVRVDAIVSSSLLHQIFYVGSPLHDGAVVIREGRIAAARVHIALSDNYHLRRDFGLRHRAAVGASEMGDAIAVVVSEERGTISIAIDGVLYVLDNADSLRMHLRRLLGVVEDDERRPIVGWFKKLFRHGKKTESYEREQEPELTMPTDSESDGEERAYNSAFVEKDSTIKKRVTGRKRKLFRRRRAGLLLTRKQRIGLAILAVIISFFMWVFVQISVNPVTTRTFIVPLAHFGLETAHKRGFGVQNFPVINVQVILRGRQKVLEGIEPGKIAAYIDVSEVNRSGLLRLPVIIDTETLLYTRTELLLPDSVAVNIYEKTPETTD